MTVMRATCYTPGANWLLSPVLSKSATSDFVHLEYEHRIKSLTRNCKLT